MTIAIAPHFTQRPNKWTAWKGIQAAKTGLHQYDEEDTAYTVWFYDGPEAHICTIWKGIVPDGVIAGGYTQEQNDADKVDFETNFKSSANMTINKINADGLSMISQEPREGSELIEVTHNFCNATTWWTQSQRIDNESLTDTGDGLIWSSTHANWIDMTHGKIFDEDSIIEEVSHGYSVVVKSNDVVMSQRNPYETFGGDYDVDYNNGHVIFFSSQSGKIITVDYSHAAGSEWRLVPGDGRKIDVEGAKAQFSEDILLNDDIVFEIWGYNPYDLPNKVMYVKSSYRRMVNYIDEAEGSYPVIPAIGGPSRGTQAAVYGFPFRYGTVRRLRSSQGIELRVKLKNEHVFGGEHATATFYCTTKDE